MILVNVMHYVIILQHDRCTATSYASSVEEIGCSSCKCRPASCIVLLIVLLDQDTPSQLSLVQQ